MATSDTEIGNLALTKLGDYRITSLTQDAPTARKLNAVYSLVRKITLEAHPWNFAIGRVSLGLLSSTPLFGYSYQFQIPGDCLRVLETDPETDFKVEAGLLLCNISSISIKYIKEVTDASKFSAAFIQAFATRLAAELAWTITNNAKLKEALMSEYTFVLGQSSASDAQEGTPQQVKQDAMDNARQMGGWAV